jgi:hypothetical protein
MAHLIKSDSVAAFFHAKKPFRVRLEYQGWTDNGNRSDKWWGLFYDPSKSALIACNHGKVGSEGRSDPFHYGLYEAIDKLSEKLDKGYGYVAGSGGPLAPAAPVATPPVVVPAAPVTVTTVESADAIMAGVTREDFNRLTKKTLPAPFEGVTVVKRVFDSGKFKWIAEDREGKLVAQLSEAGALKLKALLAA